MGFNYLTNENGDATGSFLMGNAAIRGEIISFKMDPIPQRECHVSEIG